MRRLFLLCVNLLLLFMQSIAQSKTISGTVADAQGKAIAGASVIVKGTNIGTATGNDGTFSLSIPSSARTLVISSVGYQAMEVTIANQTNFSIRMDVPRQGTVQDEVVVVAYGTTRKKPLPGPPARLVVLTSVNNRCPLFRVPLMD